MAGVINAIVSFIGLRGRGHLNPGSVGRLRRGIPMQIFTVKPKNDSLVINGEIVIELVAIGDDTVMLSCLVPEDCLVGAEFGYTA